MTVPSLCGATLINAKYSSYYLINAEALLGSTKPRALVWQHLPRRHALALRAARCLRQQPCGSATAWPTAAGPGCAWLGTAGSRGTVHHRLLSATSPPGAWPCLAWGCHAEPCTTLPTEGLRGLLAGVLASPLSCS